jgi:HTH-type transcriptional regulator/antitoxin HigA
MTCKIKPIRTDSDHETALARVDELWEAEAGTPDADELEVWGVLIDEYERRRWPLERVDPIDAIKAHMEMQGLTQTDLARLFESEPRASEILNRRRRLTVEMIAKLANEWKIPADWLVQTYELAVQAKVEERKARQTLPRRRYEALKAAKITAENTNDLVAQGINRRMTKKAYG